MPAATPRKNSTIIPHGRVPNQRSIAQPSPVATTTATTSSMPMRRPTPSPACSAERSPAIGSLRTRCACALSISLPSRPRGSGGLPSLILTNAMSDTCTSGRMAETRAHHSNAPETCQRSLGRSMDTTQDPRGPKASRLRNLALCRDPVHMRLERGIDKAVDRGRDAVAAAELYDLAGEPGQLEPVAAEQVVPHRCHVVGRHRSHHCHALLDAVGRESHSFGHTPCYCFWHSGLGECQK